MSIQTISQECVSNIIFDIQERTDYDDLWNSTPAHVQDIIRADWEIIVADAIAKYKREIEQVKADY